MDIEYVKRRVGEISWTHTLDLGNGIVTPGALASWKSPIDGVSEGFARNESA